MTRPMRVCIGSDHAGFEVQAALLQRLPELGYDAVNCGALTYNPADDYPAPCIETGQRVVADPGSFGVAIGGSAMASRSRRTRSRGCVAVRSWTYPSPMSSG